MRTTSVDAVKPWSEAEEDLHIRPGSGDQLLDEAVELLK
jgi:hypothetical protein